MAFLLEPQPETEIAKSPGSEAERCPNCGGAMPERFCTRCGQEKLPPRQTVLVLLREFVEGVFSFDSLVVRSLIPLFFQPGFLTQEYMAGRRQRYISPLKIYLTISVLFFAVNLSAPKENPIPGSGATQANVEPSSRSEKAGYSQKTPDFVTPTHFIRSRMNLRGVLKLTKSDLPESEAAYEAEQARLPQAQRDGWWTHLLTIKAIRREQLPQEQYNARVTGNLQKAMFVILPVFAFLLQLLYFRTHPLFLEHMVFTLHFQSFTFSLAIFQQLLHLQSPMLKGIIVLCGVVYEFEAVRRVYKQWLPVTILKFLLLMIAWAFVLQIIMAALTYLTVFLL